MNRAQYVNQSQKVFSIDSSQRISGSSSNFAIKLNMPQSNAFNKCAVVVCEIPKSFYSLDSSSTNTFLCNATTITIPKDVFYTASTFASAVQTALVSGMGVAMTCSYSSTTGKMTITHPSTTFTITATGVLAKYLGLVSSTTTSSTGTSLVCTNISNMQRFDVLYIRASSVQNNNDNVLLTIYPGLSTDLSVIQYSNVDSSIHNCTIEGNNTNIMNFSLQDKDNNDVNLNGVDWRLLLWMGNE